MGNEPSIEIPRLELKTIATACTCKKAIQSNLQPIKQSKYFGKANKALKQRKETALPCNICGYITPHTEIAVSGYIKYIESTYDLSHIVPRAMIQIINYYYEMLSQPFPFDDKMTIKDFEIHKLCNNVDNVWKVELKAKKQIFALKIVKKKKLIACKPVNVIYKNISPERRILANIDHPFIVSLRYVFQTKSKLFMVMDFYDAMPLFRLQGKFTETRAKLYSAEIFLAIEYLHDNNITFTDLKGGNIGNILLDIDGHIKISDFCSSDYEECISYHPSYITRTFCGSQCEYLAPEMLRECGYMANDMVDWWSLGIILYEMLCGVTPFYDGNIEKIRQNILYQSVTFQSFMSDDVIELISKLLIKNPHERIKCDKIKQSDFFRSIDWDKLYNKQIQPPSPWEAQAKISSNVEVPNELFPSGSRSSYKYEPNLLFNGGIAW